MEQQFIPLTSSSSFKLFLSLFCHIGLLQDSQLVCYSWSQSPLSPLQVSSWPLLPYALVPGGSGGRGRVQFHPGFSVILTGHTFWVIASRFWPQSPAHIPDAEVNVHGRALTRNPPPTVTGLVDVSTWVTHKHFNPNSLKLTSAGLT